MVGYLDNNPKKKASGSSAQALFCVRSSVCINIYAQAHKRRIKNP